MMNNTSLRYLLSLSITAICAVSLNAQTNSDWENNFQYAKNYYNNNQFDSARYYFEEAKKIGELIFDKSDWQMGINTSYLGEVCFKLGDLDAAEENYRYSLESRELTHGQKSTQYLAALYQLANIYESKSEFDLALIYYQEAIPVFEFNKLNHTAGYSQTLLNVGDILLVQGDTQMAVNTLRRGMDTIAKYFGKDIELYNTYASKLSDIYFKISRIDQSIIWQNEVIEHFVARYGEQYVLTGTAVQTLALLHTINDDVSAAESAYFRAMRIFENNLDVASDNYTSVLNSLIAINEQQNDVKQLLKLNRIKENIEPK